MGQPDVVPLPAPVDRECGCDCEGCSPESETGYGIEHCGIKETGCIVDAV
jgi:hypothetical protein